MSICLATLRLRGRLFLNLAAAAAGAMVLVATVVLVRSDLGFGDTQVALAVVAFGGGSMLAALILPRLLGSWPDRPVMILGAAALVVTFLGLAALTVINGVGWYPLLAGRLVIGMGYSTALTLSGRLLKRSAHPERQARPLCHPSMLAGWSPNPLQDG